MAKGNLDAFKTNNTETVIDASKKVKVGIIGTGWIAEAHIQQYLKMPDVEIVAGADLIPGKAEKFFAEFESKYQDEILTAKQNLLAYKEQLKQSKTTI